MDLLGIRNAVTDWIKAAISVCLTALSGVAALVLYDQSPTAAIPYAALAVGLAVFFLRMAPAMARVGPDARRSHADALFFVPLCGIACATLLVSVISGRTGIPDVAIALLALVTGLFARSALRHVREGTNRPDRGWAVARSRRDIRAALDRLKDARRR